MSDRSPAQPPIVQRHVGRSLRGRVLAVLGAMALSVLPAVPLTTGVASAADDRTTFAHIFVIVMENQRYEDLLGNPDTPFINGVLEKDHASATRFFAPFHNSPSDYYAMSSGKGYSKGDGGEWGGTCLPSMACSTDDPSVFQQLNEIGKSWRVYSEDQDQPCQIVNAKKYWVGHNPAVYYRNLGPNAYTQTGNGSCQTSSLGYGALKADIAADSVPEFAFLIPNNCNNMHDKCPPLNDDLKQGDAWLQDQLVGDATVPGGLIEWSKANDTLIIVTFDESHFSDSQTCCPYADTGGGGHIPTWVIGPQGKVRDGGFKSNVDYSLYSILKLVELNFGLPLLGHAADATTADLIDFLPSRIELDRTAGIAGATTDVKGKDYAPGERVTFLWNCPAASCPDGREIATVTADANGGFSATLNVPEGEQPGTFAVGARGDTSGSFGYAPFTVRRPLETKPAFAAHGEQIAVSGAGYAADEPVRIYWDCPADPCPAAKEIGATKADATGAFDQLAVTLPPTARKGPYTLRAVGDTSHATGATKFTITETLVVSPEAGVATSALKVTGRSFTPGEQITLAWDCKNHDCGSSPVLATATADENGDFKDVTITVPGDTKDGNYPIGARGVSASSFARDWFKVKQPLSLFPTSGPPGKTLALAGAGFAEDEEVQLFWNCREKGCPGGTSIGMAPSDDNGELSAVPVAIPAGIAGGTYHVGGVGSSSGAFATTTVVVTPQLTASPARGAANWNVKLKGAGFAPGQAVDILWDCDGSACTDAPPVASTTANQQGGFDGVSFRVPESARPGPHRIAARAAGAADVVVSAFSVETVLDVSPKKGEAGWNATVTGTGFGPNESITLAWDCDRADCAPDDKLRTAEADGNGAFSIKLQIPNGAAVGDHRFIAIGDDSRSSAVSTFSVTGPSAANPPAAGAGSGGAGGAGSAGSGGPDGGAPGPTEDANLAALLRLVTVAAVVVAVLVGAGWVFVRRLRRTRA